jgi:cell division protein FtsB
MGNENESLKNTSNRLERENENLESEISHVGKEVG